MEENGEKDDVEKKVGEIRGREEREKRVEETEGKEWGRERE